MTPFLRQTQSGAETIDFLNQVDARRGIVPAVYHPFANYSETLVAELHLISHDLRMKSSQSSIHSRDSLSPG
jgi:hypothetical protein